MSETRGRDPELPYAPPLAAVGVPGVFRARTWYRWLILGVIAGIATLCLGTGILFATVRMIPNGSGWRDGVPMMAIGLAIGAVAALSGVPIVARRGPVLRACREGLEVRLFGPSRIYGVPSAPGFGRLTWTLISGGTCRFPMLRIRWAEVGGVMVVSHQWERILAIHREPGGGREGGWVMLRQSEIVAIVDEVARALPDWAGDENAREALPGWGDPE